MAFPFWATLAIMDILSLALASLVGLTALAYVTGTIRYIPNHRTGVVEKLWSASGSLRSGFVARQGDAGYQGRSAQ